MGIINVDTGSEERTGQPVCGIIGGTHLVEAGEERLEATIKELQEEPLEFLAVCHCTGDHMERLQEVFQERFIYNITGNVITF